MVSDERYNQNESWESSYRYLRLREGREQKIVGKIAGGVAKSTETVRQGIQWLPGLLLVTMGVVLGWLVFRGFGETRKHPANRFNVVT